jgi:hypothetical protein
MNFFPENTTDFHILAELKKLKPNNHEDYFYNIYFEFGCLKFIRPNGSCT